jgi:phage baseplate assembly protein W
LTPPLYLALRFVLPEVVTDTSGSTPPGFLRGAAQEPGLQHSPRGGLSTVTGEDSVRQALLLLISTQPGERVNRPTYGCDLHRLMFAPADDTTAGLAIHYVQQALAQWEPRVDVVALDAVTQPEPPAIEIQLSYRLKTTSAVDTLSVLIPLGGGLSA